MIQVSGSREDFYHGERRQIKLIKGTILVMITLYLPGWFAETREHGKVIKNKSDEARNGSDVV